MPSVTIEIKEDAFEKVIYLLEQLKDVVKIIKRDDVELEISDKNNSDYKYVLAGKKSKENGKKTYSLNEVIKQS